MKNLLKLNNDSLLSIYVKEVVQDEDVDDRFVLGSIADTLLYMLEGIPGGAMVNEASESLRQAKEASKQKRKMRKLIVRAINIMNFIK